MLNNSIYDAMDTEEKLDLVIAYLENTEDFRQYVKGFNPTFKRGDIVLCKSSHSDPYYKNKYFPLYIDRIVLPNEAISTNLIHSDMRFRYVDEVVNVHRDNYSDHYPTVDLDHCTPLEYAYIIEKLEYFNNGKPYKTPHLELVFAIEEDEIKSIHNVIRYKRVPVVLDK